LTEPAGLKAPRPEISEQSKRHARTGRNILIAAGVIAAIGVGTTVGEAIFGHGGGQETGLQQELDMFSGAHLTQGGLEGDQLTVSVDLNANTAVVGETKVGHELAAFTEDAKGNWEETVTTFGKPGKEGLPITIGLNPTQLATGGVRVIYEAVVGNTDDRSVELTPFAGLEAVPGQTTIAGIEYSQLPKVPTSVQEAAIAQLTQ
jgi:hypothetical protein